MHLAEFEVGVVSIIACFAADSRVYCRRLAYCTDHFSARVIIKKNRGLPPNTRKPNSGLWTRDYPTQMDAPYPFTHTIAITVKLSDIRGGKYNIPSVQSTSLYFTSLLYLN